MTSAAVAKMFNPSDLMKVSPYFGLTNKSFSVLTSSFKLNKDVDVPHSAPHTPPPPPPPTPTPTTLPSNSNSNNARDLWECSRAKALGIPFRPVTFQVEGKPCEMYPVSDTALLYGLPTSKLIEFGKRWSKTKTELQHCREFRVFCQKGMDYVSRKLYDQCVAPLFESPYSKTDYNETSSSPTKEYGPSKAPQPISSSSSTDTWRVCPSKRLEHEEMLSQLGNSRANYIAQIGPLDFKFGCTDKGILNRTTEHMKDFEHFNLVFAEHCYNTYRAEALFKADPSIKKRRKNVKTQRNNHTEIVTIDADLTESKLKELYLFYITKVNTEEQLRLNQNQNQTSNADRRDSSEEPGPPSLSPQKGIEKGTTIDPLQLEVARIEIEFVRVHQDHEFRMKQLEWEEKKWSAKHVMDLAGRSVPYLASSMHMGVQTETEVLSVPSDEDDNDMVVTRRAEDSDESTSMSSDLTELGSEDSFSEQGQDDDLRSALEDDESSDLEEFFEPMSHRHSRSPLPIRKRQRNTTVHSIKSRRKEVQVIPPKRKSRCRRAI